MAEESLDNKSIALASPSGTQSPRRIIGNGNGNNNDTNAGCIGAVAVTTGPAGSTVTTVVNESVPTTNIGIVVAGTPTTVAAAAAAAASSSSVAAVVGATAAATAAVATAPSSSLLPLQSTLTTSASISGATTVTGAATSGGGGGGVTGMIVSPGTGIAGAKNGGNSSPRSPKHPRKLRVKLSEQQLESATKEELAAKWREQDLYVECLEAQAAAQEGELTCLRDSEEKYRQQCCEISHRERILARRLASKEQQLVGYVNQITEMRASQVPSSSALRSALLDPAVNILIQKLRQELLSTKAKLEDTQNELSAWKFTPDSNTGKRLMAKCRLLYQENEELGRMIASGRIAKLEGELVLQKSFSEEVKKSQSELDEFLQDLDEDVEGMQSTIYFLQQELRKARESVSLLQQENNAFKSVSTGPPPQPPPQPPPPQPPPPPLEVNSGLSNGVASKVEPAALGDEPVKLVDSIERQVGGAVDVVVAAAAAAAAAAVTATDDNAAGRIIEPSSPTSVLPPVPSVARTLSTDTNEATGSLSDERKFERCRPDDPDESSNDSAALIIKVENEELSDREDEDELEGVPGRGTVVETCETRGPQRQSLRTRDKITMKNESAVVGKSNGDERNSSRSSSRRLLRDRTAKRDKSAADSDDEHRMHKKKRRESILSLDYNETDDDALLLTNGESIQSDTEDGP